MTDAINASSVSVSESQAPSITCGCTAANRAIITALARVRDDVGLTNQVCALKPGQEFKKVGGQFDFRFRAPLRTTHTRTQRRSICSSS